MNTFYGSTEKYHFLSLSELVNALESGLAAQDTSGRIYKSYELAALVYEAEDGLYIVGKIIK